MKKREDKHKRSKRPGLNKAQLKATAELLLEVVKWILISVVLASFVPSFGIELKKGGFGIALILALVLYFGAMRILKEVKEDD